MVRLTMEAINVSTFKAQCLALVENVNQSGEPLVVTKRGKPLVTVSPATSSLGEKRSPFGCMAGTAEELEDIVAPLDLHWNALED